MKPFDPGELLSVLVAIAREGAPKSHIMKEFERLCADSSFGLKEEHDLFHPRTQTPATPSPSGGEPSGRPTEDDWFKYQDRDQNWIRHWEEQELDDVDPQHWK